MGQGCFRPNNNLKHYCKNNIEEKKKEYVIPSYNYSEILKQIINDISKKYLNVNIQEDLVSRTLPKRSITKNEDEEVPSKILKKQEIIFFDEMYSIEDLEEFLSNCSNVSPYSLTDNDSDGTPLYERVLSDSVDVKNIKKDDVEYLFQNEKIHLKLAENECYIKILTRLLKRAFELRLLTDVIDIENEFGNPAISIAVLKKNPQAFFYLLENFANIPIYIFHESEKTPFLIYLATHGKLRKSKENNQVEYILYRVLNYIILNYEKEYLSEHLTTIDEKTRLSLPHMLLNLYNTSAELNSSIVDCLRLINIAYPDCFSINCVNYYEPKFKFDVLAKCIAHPDLSAEVACEFYQKLKPSLNENNKAMLRHLVKVHQNKKDKTKILLHGLD